MQEYDLSQWVLFFFLYSFLGWIWESCYVSVRKHRWVNRGFMHGPMLPLYGSGAMVVLIVTIPVRDNILLVFLMGMIGATILEYFTGITMERLFHVRYWDYRNLKFNVRGYICPLASLCWGAFSILMVKVVHIPFEHMVLLIPVTIADILAFVLTIAAAVDFTQSFNEAMDMKRILVQLEASKEQIQKMQERLKDASEEMQDRLKDASEGVQERLKRASEGVQERLEDSYLLYEERKVMKAAEKQTRKELYLAKIEEQRIEPSDVGADMIVGSLIKNPGGGLAPIGGYIAGRADLIENCAYRLTSPGLGKEVGATLGITQSFYQGFFLAPTVVCGALKGATFAANIYEALGYPVIPNGSESRHDIIQAVTLGSAEGVIAFCKGIQAAAPVDSYVSPDGPVKPPYAVYFQGGLTWYHAKLGILKSLQSVIDAGVLSIERVRELL